MNEAEDVENIAPSATHFPPSLRVREVEGQFLIGIKGDWTIETIQDVEKDVDGLLNEMKSRNLTPNNVEIYINNLKDLDSAGAFLLCEIIKCHSEQVEITDKNVIGEHEFARRFLKEVEKFVNIGLNTPTKKSPVQEFKEKFDDAVKDISRESIETISFIGATVYSLVKAIANPGHVRWIPTIAVAESAGLNAIPIVMTLSFFIGAVVAFMGAQTLSSFGATVFTVDLVGISVLREFAVLITAIILAGRSDSAFTAQIGSMKMTQEIDAMSIIGLDPMEMLVIPRVIALLIMMPILVFFAMIAGILGGAFVSVYALDISFSMYLTRLQEHVGEKHFWTGMAKAPVFAFIIAIIGCRQGLEVENDVISLGKHTTAAVVQAIFMVIIVDAIFALIYNELNI